MLANTDEYIECHSGSPHALIWILITWEIQFGHRYGLCVVAWASLDQNWALTRLRRKYHHHRHLCDNDSDTYHHHHHHRLNPPPHHHHHHYAQSSSYEFCSLCTSSSRLDWMFSIITIIIIISFHRHHCHHMIIYEFPPLCTTTSRLDWMFASFLAPIFASAPSFHHSHHSHHSHHIDLHIIS